MLEARGVMKSFPGVRALSNVDLKLVQGEVLAMLGENGAGKSTLMKILAGVQAADEGAFFLEGEPVQFGNVREAMESGVVLIHQELNLADNLDIASNVFLGRELLRFGLLDENQMRLESAKYLKMVGLELDPATPLATLSIAQQQLVEIAKALSVDARVLIMDEPTSSLSQTEADKLFEVIRDLTKQGVSVVYISHRLGEISIIADRVMVLRDGCHAGELIGDEISHDAMVRLMVGREVDEVFQRGNANLGGVVLMVDQVHTEAFPAQEISFQISAGEIVGVSGLVGAGRSELLEAIFGLMPIRSGEVKIAGEVVQARSCRDAIAAGLAFVPEDRKKQGAILDMAVLENISLAGLHRNCRKGGFLDQKKERELADKSIVELSIKTPDVSQLVRHLSGGNQQKVVLSKWLAMEPKVLLLDEPTRGIDVGAKQEIYRLIEDLAEQGMAILFVSSEMEEVMGLSDRVLVMHEGSMAGELTRDECSEETIMSLATGTNISKEKVLA